MIIHTWLPLFRVIPILCKPVTYNLHFLRQRKSRSQSVWYWFSEPIITLFDEEIIFRRLRKLDFSIKNTPWWSVLNYKIRRTLKRSQQIVESLKSYKEKEVRAPESYLNYITLYYKVQYTVEMAMFAVFIIYPDYIKL